MFTLNYIKPRKKEEIKCEENLVLKRLQDKTFKGAKKNERRNKKWLKKTQ